MKKYFPLFFAFLFHFVFSSTLQAEDLLPKIQAISDQNSVKPGMMFLVRARVINPGSGKIDFWANTCSYEKHWVTDHAGVFIQSWTCQENSLEEITLDSEKAYEKNIIIYIPKGDPAGSVTFRLGFKRMSENGEVAEPLWSDPIIMHMIVPEGSEKPVTTSAKGAPVLEKKQSTPTRQEAAKAIVQKPAPGKILPEVFTDPNVPIKIKRGEDFSISLASNPSAGFRWKMALPRNQKILVFLGSVQGASQKGMPQSLKSEIYKFKAFTMGEIKVDFLFQRPSETITASPRKIFTVLVQEN